MGARTYVSETVVDEQRWYRLRAGPFVNEAAAKQALANSRGEFPKAWVAISDDDTLNEVGTPSGVATVRSTAPQVNASMTPDEIKRTLAQAKDAFRHKDYATAIPLLTQVTQQPEFPQRADAQEMLALARERSGQVAHAKAEYEDYLQRYPTGDGPTRVRKRLQALAWASRPGRERIGRQRAGRIPVAGLRRLLADLPPGPEPHRKRSRQQRPDDSERLAERT